MNWSNEWNEERELIFTDDERHEYKVKATIVGDLAVHSDRAGWSYVVTHVPTMTKFGNAVPLLCETDKNGYENYMSPSKQQLSNWCQKVQKFLPLDWAALRTLTPDNYHDLPEVRQKIRDFCLSVPV